jgi:arylsulfatase A-like enzyme
VLSRRKTTPILAGVLGGLLTSVVIGNWQRNRPNVVMVVIDSMRSDAITEVIGAAHLPNLRSLIDEGVLFPNAFAHSSSTVAAHVALHSGMLPHQVGVRSEAREVHDRVPLLAQTLRDNGYQTAAAVSLKSLWKPRNGEGLARGFQRYEQGRLPIQSASEVSQRLTSILDGLDRNGSFFLLAHFSDPHEPFEDHGSDARRARVLLDDRLLEEIVISRSNFWKQRMVLTPGEHLFELASDTGIRVRDFEVRGPRGLMPYDLRLGDLGGDSQRIVMVLENPTDADLAVEIGAWIHDHPSLQELRTRYLRELEAVDRALGEFLAELKWRGLYDDTVFVVTSSHGVALGEHGLVGNAPNLFDEVLSVPLIVRVPPDWPARAALVSNSPELVRLVDIAPTILELCRVTPWDGMAGVSLLNEAKRQVMAQAVESDRADGFFAMRDSRYKMIYRPGGNGSYELYRLSSDPLELDNVMGHQGHLRKDWQMQLRQAAGALGLL